MENLLASRIFDGNEQWGWWEHRVFPLLDSCVCAGSDRSTLNFTLITKASWGFLEYCASPDPLVIPVISWLLSCFLSDRKVAVQRKWWNWPFTISAWSAKESSFPFTFNCTEFWNLHYCIWVDLLTSTSINFEFIVPSVRDMFTDALKTWLACLWCQVGDATLAALSSLP